MCVMMCVCPGVVGTGEGERRVGEEAVLHRPWLWQWPTGLPSHQGRGEQILVSVF